MSIPADFIEILNIFRNDKNETITCRPGYFMCDNICLPQSKLCDGKVDCFAYDDEANCNGEWKLYENLVLFNIELTLRHLSFQLLQEHRIVTIKWASCSHTSERWQQPVSWYSGTCQRMALKIKTLNIFHRSRWPMKIIGQITLNGLQILNIVSRIWHRTQCIM